MDCYFAHKNLKLNLMPRNTLQVELDLSAMRHSCAHVLAAAVLQMFPEAQLGVGPVIQDGFYYDFLLPRTLIPEDLPLLEEKMKKIVTAGYPFEGKEATFAEAKKMLKAAKQPFKVELVEEIEKGERQAKTADKVSFYHTGPFVDLCKGGHVKTTKDIGAFKLLSIAGAYWKGDPTRPMLQRVYGACWPTQKELDEYLERRAEAEKRDHRKLGEAMDLFSFHKEGPGFVFWHPHGTKLLEVLTARWRRVHEREGYQEVQTPYLLDEKLWRQSGHWDHYRENMYFAEVDSGAPRSPTLHSDGDGALRGAEKRKFAVKPMNCPGMILIYKTRQHSYRELPLKLFELGQVHRHELSGVLHGLFRVRSFTIDDAHLFVIPTQIEAEIGKLIVLALQTYQTFELGLAKVELSTRPKHSVGDDAMWQQAEVALKTALDTVIKEKILTEYTVSPGEGAFYGPKIDFHVEDSLGRTWQLGTIQLDFSMPERFKLEYIGEDGKRHQPVMIHRAIFGSVERFIGILLEHTGGRLPFWLAAEQVRILPITDAQNHYATMVERELHKENIRASSDMRTESIGKKIRDAEGQKIPVVAVVGKKEVGGKTITIRSSDGTNQTLQLERFLATMKSNNRVLA